MGRKEEGHLRPAYNKAFWGGEGEELGIQLELRPALAVDSLTEVKKGGLKNDPWDSDSIGGKAFALYGAGQESTLSILYIVPEHRVGCIAGCASPKKATTTKRMTP